MFMSLHNSSHSKDGSLLSPFKRYGPSIKHDRQNLFSIERLQTFKIIKTYMQIFRLLPFNTFKSFCILYGLKCLKTIVVKDGFVAHRTLMTKEH